jgi:hypothetical protein
MAFFKPLKGLTSGQKGLRSFLGQPIRLSACRPTRFDPTPLDTLQIQAKLTIPRIFS